MDLHHTGCSTEPLIFLENDELCLYLKGSSENKKRSFSAIEDHASYSIRCNKPIVLDINGKSIGRGTYQQAQLEPLFFEQQFYELVVESKLGKKITFDHDHPSIRRQVNQLGKHGRLLTGVLNFRNEIGYTDLRILVEDQWYLTLTIEVYPSKMNYKSDYQALLTDVNEEIYNLAFDFIKATYTSAGINEQETGSLTEFYSILKRRFDELIHAIDIILMRPHHKLVQNVVIGRPRPQYMNNTQSINYLNKHPQQRYYKALNMVKEVTYDTHENRLIKYWIKSIVTKLQRIKDHYRKMWRQTDEHLIRQIEQFQNSLLARLREPMMKSVSELSYIQGFSLVMQMAVGYRDVYRLYLILMRGLSLVTECYEISTKNVAELYEYWCFIKLGSILRDKYQLISHDLIKVNHKGLFLTLEKGKSSELLFSHPITKEQFKLRYNPMATNLPTVAQKPDNMLELHKEMTGITYKYVFDAKYKVDYKELEDGRVYERPKESDINTMHRYRDAIVYENKDLGQYERTVFGAFVLFPGHQGECYKEDEFYKSIESVGIGGFPFLPSQTKLVSEFLEQLVDESGHEHYRMNQLPKGTSTYLEDRLIEKRNVLVGNVVNNSQLEGIKKHLIYHIPLRKVRSKMLGIEYVALYESKTYSIGGIQYWGKVRSLEIVPRRKLLKQFPTTKNNLDEEYVVYSLEAIEKLKTPIQANHGGMRDRRYTNKTLLEYATTLSELSIKSDEEFRLYLALKRIAQDYKGVDHDDENQYIAQVNEFKIYIDQDNLVVDQGGNIKYIDLELLRDNLIKVVKQIIT